MKSLACSLLFVCALSITPASAQLILNGGFENGADFVDFGFSDVMTTSQIDAGWVTNTNSSRTFGDGESSSTLADGWDSNSSNRFTDGGNPNSWMIANNGLDNSAATMWNLSTWDDDVPEVTVDVIVNNNEGNLTGAVVGNSGNIEYAIYGFTGDETALGTALGTADFGTPDNKLSDPNGVSGFTQLASGSLSPVGALNTWETQSITSSNTTSSYDYLLVGFYAPDTIASYGAGIDNVTVIPEPSTVALLAGSLGFLTLVKRRRLRRA